MGLFDKISSVLSCEPYALLTMILYVGEHYCAGIYWANEAFLMVLNVNLITTSMQWPHKAP